LFWFFDIEEKINIVFNSTFPRRSPNRHFISLRAHEFNKHNLQHRIKSKISKTMYNHECRELHYNLHFMHCINIHNTVRLQVQLTEQMHYCKLPPTAPPILYGSFSPNRTPLKYSQIARNDKVYRQLHQLVLKTRKLVTSGHNSIYLQCIQSQRTLSPTNPFCLRIQVL
jgi:hypothetical protein